MELYHCANTRKSCNICHCSPCRCGCPAGPSIGTIIPYSFSYLYLSNFESEVFIENEFFIMPTDGRLERLILSLDIFDYFINDTATGTVEFRVYTSPISSYVPTLVASGTFQPLVTSSLPIGSVLIADKILNVPVFATTRIGIAIAYSTNDFSGSFINATLYGGLHIV